MRAVGKKVGSDRFLSEAFLILSRGLISNATGQVKQLARCFANSVIGAAKFLLIVDLTEGA